MKEDIIFYMMLVAVIVNVFSIGLNHQDNIKNMFTDKNKEVQIIYEDLSEEDIIAVNLMVDDLKKEYLDTTEKIIFMGNQTKLAKKYGDVDLTLVRRSRLVRMGCNINNKDIYVFTTKEFGRDWYFYEDTRGTLCHELLHNVIEIEGEEDIIERIEDMEFCYPNFSLELNKKWLDVNLSSIQIIEPIIFTENKMFVVPNDEKGEQE